MYSAINTRINPTTGYARALKFMFIQPELGGMGTGCLFQFTYCDIVPSVLYSKVKTGRVANIHTVYIFNPFKAACITLSKFQPIRNRQKFAYMSIC